MRTFSEEKKLRATYKYGKPLTITVDGPVGNGRTEVTHGIWRWLYECPSIIFKQIDNYKIQLEYPRGRKKGK